MYRSYQENALIIARRIIYAFYVDKDIESIISYLNPENFMYTCTNTNETVVGVDNMRNFLFQAVNYTDDYKITRENYQICGSSIDSCLVVADIETQAAKYHIPYLSNIKFLFQFILVEKELLISYCQVQIPFKIQNKNSAFFLSPNKSPIESHIDWQYHFEMLLNLLDNNSISMKVVHCQPNLPYHYVNLKFLNLLQCPCIKDFVAENKNSIEHIFPADQKRYRNFVKSHIQKSLKNLQPSKTWQWHNSYYIIYRIFNRENFYVLECGNLFTLNSSQMIMAIVLPLQDISIFYNLTNKKEKEFQSTDYLLDNFGIRISKNFILYQMKRQALIDGKLVDFTPTEFEILLNFVDNINKPLTLEKIYGLLWNNEELQMTSNTLRMHISNIRRKLKISDKPPVHLDTIPNEGYKFWVDLD